MKKTIILLLALHLCTPGYSQTPCAASFSGHIEDESHNPVFGAAIVLSSGEGQMSGASGEFSFGKLCSGTYTVKVQFLGYVDKVLKIAVKDSVKLVISLEEAVTQLEEVVVQHHDETHTENATNFVMLDEKQLAEAAGKSLGESLREIPGVTSLQTGPGIFKPVIHGLHSQRILILNYGIRHEGQQWGAEHAPEIDPFVASTIVVIKDASAIKYGTDALGGVVVVNPASLPVQAGIGGTFNSVLQSNGRSVTLSGMLEGGIKDHEGWGWRIQGTGKRSGDFNTPKYSLTNTGIKELNFSASTGYHKDNRGFDVFFSHFKTEIGILKGTSIGNLDDLVTAMERDIPQYTSDFSYTIGEPHQEVSHNLLKLNGHIHSGLGEWRLQYGFQNNNRKEFDIRIGPLSQIPSIDLRLNTHTLDGEWEPEHSDKRTITFGINGMLQSNTNIPGTQRIPFIPNFNSASVGVFGVTKLFLDAWTIDLGARYDFRHYDVKGYDFKNTLYKTSFSFHNISATAGATLHAASNQTLTFNLSSSWRPPHVAELYSVGTHQSAAAIEYGLLLNDTSNTVMDINASDFKIEQAVKFVTSYSKAWRGLSLEISPYANYIFNYIYLRPMGITKNVRGVYPYFRYSQTDALFLGADIIATWQAGKYVKVIPRASLLRASDELNHDFLVFIPSNRYEIALRYERPRLSFLHNFYIESKGKYVARQMRAPRVVSVRTIKESQEQNIDPFGNDPSNFDFMAAPDGYFMVNVAAGTSIKRGTMQYDLRLASDNTLNQQYRDYTNRFRYYSDDAGRTIVLSIKLIF